MKVLIPGRGTPPGGYPFVDQRTGQKFGGFEQDFIGRVRQIIAHRQANPAIYLPHETQHFSIEQVSRELQEPICAKHPSYCMETTPVGPPVAQMQTVVVAPQSPNCPACGSLEWKPEYCPTCGGQRLKGYICAKCGLKRPR